jgi:hypothetical protein
MPQTYEQIIERGRDRFLGLAEFDEAKHPRWPKGTPEVGGEFMTVANVLDRLKKQISGELDLTAEFRKMPGVRSVKAYTNPHGGSSFIRVESDVQSPLHGTPMHDDGWLNPSSKEPLGDLVQQTLDELTTHSEGLHKQLGIKPTKVPGEPKPGDFVRTNQGDFGIVQGKKGGKHEVRPLAPGGDRGNGPFLHDAQNTLHEPHDLNVISSGHGGDRPTATAITLREASTGQIVYYGGERWRVTGKRQAGDLQIEEVKSDGFGGHRMVYLPPSHKVGLEQGNPGKKGDMKASIVGDLFAATPRGGAGSDAPDPSLAGPIRNIVRTAHKWGGNGVIPKFNKIKRVLSEKHPEVFAHFGGDPNKAAAWIKDNWMAMHGHDPHKWRGKGKSVAQQLATSIDLGDLYEEAADVIVALAADQGVTHELFCDGGPAEIGDDGLIWKTAARTGTWKLSPLPGGEPLTIDKPLLDDVQAAFDDGAWEHVTVPLSHADRVDENTGYVKALKVEPDPHRPGQHVLRTGIKFTDPDVRKKVSEGSIANCSVGVSLSGHTRTEDGKFFPRVLKHVALTNRPWLNGLAPFGEGDATTEIAADMACFELDDIERPDLWGDLNLDDDGDDPDGDNDPEGGPDDDNDEVGDTGKIAWDADDDVDAIRSEIREALPPGSIILGMTFDKVLCRIPGNGDSYGPMGGTAYVAGYKYDPSQEGVTVEPSTQWQKVQQGWLEAAQKADKGKDKGPQLQPVSQLAKGDKFMLNAAVHLHLGKHRSMPNHVAARNQKTGNLVAVPMTQKVRKAPSSGPGDFGLAVDVLGSENLLFLGWLEDAGVKRGDLDDGDFLIPETKTLPYKVHGKVNSKGWLAAWNVVNGGHGFTPPSGTSVDSLKKKLLASKPKGQDVNASLGAVVSVRGSLQTSTTSKGGNMGEDGKTDGEMLTLSRDDLEAAIEARVNERFAEQQAQLSQTQAELHERTVADKCRDLQSKGHAPALIERAKAYYLADVRGESVLTLSQDKDGETEEVTYTVTDVIDDLLAAMPKTSLAHDAPRHLALAREPGTGGEPKTAEEVKETADRVMEDLKNGKATLVSGAAIS